MIGKRLLIYSPEGSQSSDLISRFATWGCRVMVCQDPDQMRGEIEGGDYDMVFFAEPAVLSRLVTEADPTGKILSTPLHQVERRHVLRVLSASAGNKTRAARILGIDIKTLYNRLRGYLDDEDLGSNRATTD